MSARLESARQVEKEVPANIFKAMQEEAAAAKARTGLQDVEVTLSSTLKIGDL